MRVENGISPPKGMAAPAGGGQDRRLRRRSFPTAMREVIARRRIEQEKIEYPRRPRPSEQRGYVHDLTKSGDLQSLDDETGDHIFWGIAVAAGNGA